MSIINTKLQIFIIFVKNGRLLTAVIVQHVRQKLVSSIDVVVYRENVLRQWIPMQTEHNKMKQFSQLIRQIAKQVVTQVKFSENKFCS